MVGRELVRKIEKKQKGKRARLAGVCVKRGKKSEIKIEVLGGLGSVPKRRE